MSFFRVVSKTDEHGITRHYPQCKSFLTLFLLWDNYHLSTSKFTLDELEFIRTYLRNTKDSTHAGSIHKNEPMYFYTLESATEFIKFVEQDLAQLLKAAEKIKKNNIKTTVTPIKL